MKETFENPAQDPAILMQAQLLKRHPDWIEAHAAEFRDFIGAHPEIVDGFKKHPEETVRNLEERFYH